MNLRRRFLLVAFYGYGALARVGDNMYQLKRRRVQTEELTLKQVLKIGLTYSEDSPPKSLTPFYLSLFETDGELPSDPSLASVKGAMSDFMKDELSAAFGENNPVRKVNVKILSQRSTATSSRGRSLQMAGSQLETSIDVVFEHEPSPLRQVVESVATSILSGDLSNFLSNLTVWAEGDPELKNVRSAVTEEIPTGYDDDHGGSAIVDGGIGSRDASASVKYYIPVVVVCFIAVVLIATLAAKRRKVEEIEVEPEPNEVINIYLDEESDIFSVEATLVESPAKRPLRKKTRDTSPDDQSDIFSGLESDFTSPKNGEARSIFSFFSAFSRGDASTVVASNVTKKDKSGAAMATAAAAAVAAGTVGVVTTKTTTPHSRVSSLFTFSEEGSEDLESDDGKGDNERPTSPKSKMTSSPVSSPRSQGIPISAGRIESSPRGLSDNSPEGKRSPTRSILNLPISPVKSPAESRSKSPVESRSKSPVKSRSKSPVKSRSKSPVKSPRSPGRESSNELAFGSDHPFDEPTTLRKTESTTEDSSPRIKRTGTGDSSSYGPQPIPSNAAGSSYIVPSRSPRKMPSPSRSKLAYLRVSASDMSPDANKSTVSPSNMSEPSFNVKSFSPSEHHVQSGSTTFQFSDSEAPADDRNVDQNDERRKGEWGFAAAMSVVKNMGRGRFLRRNGPQSPLSDNGEKHRNELPENQSGYSSDPGPGATKRSDASSTEINLKWDNPEEADNNRAKAAAFVGTVSQIPGGAVTHAEMRKARRHTKETAHDGTTNYQTQAMDPMDWSYHSFDADSNCSSDDSPPRQRTSPRTRSTIREIPPITTISPRSPQSNGRKHTPKSAATSLSGASARTEGTGSTEASASKQLISDLVWLEKKIAGTATTVVSSPKSEEHNTPGGLDHCDSLSFTSNDGAVSTSGSNEDSTIDLASPRGHASPKRGPQSIVCRDVYAPPGKLKIVIHSTKDGPAVHTVKKGSSLEGHIFAGDLIISVDNVDTRSYTAEQVMIMMTTRTRYERKITVLHFENDDEPTL